MRHAHIYFFVLLLLTACKKNSSAEHRSSNIIPTNKTSDIKLISDVFIDIAKKQHIPQESKKEFIQRISKFEKNLYCFWLLDMNVKNGGFLQYLNNTKGETLNEALKAAEIMDIIRIQNILVEALQILENTSYVNNEPTFTTDQSKRLSELDKEYYSIDKENYIIGKVAQYIKSNPKGFNL